MFTAEHATDLREHRERGRAGAARGRAALLAAYGAARELHAEELLRGAPGATRGAPGERGGALPHESRAHSQRPRRDPLGALRPSLPANAALHVAALLEQRLSHNHCEHRSPLPQGSAVSLDSNITFTYSYPRRYAYFILVLTVHYFLLVVLLIN